MACVNEEITHDFVSNIIARNQDLPVSGSKGTPTSFKFALNQNWFIERESFPSKESEDDEDIQLLDDSDDQVLNQVDIISAPNSKY